MIATATASHSFSPLFISSTASTNHLELSSRGKLGRRDGGYGSSATGVYGGKSSGVSSASRSAPASASSVDEGVPDPHPNGPNELDRSRMYVRALYDYSTDDTTSLSFRAGDVIQVLKQLDSGWWDGIVNGQRGWFPSNYCILVAPGEQVNGNLAPCEDSDDPDDDDSYSEYDYESASSDSEHGLASPGLPMEGTNLKKNDVAGLWVPQATPNGRLFYFNLDTGESRQELPLETPTSTTEIGPRERRKSIPETSRPPPEILAKGYEGDEVFNRAGKSDGEGSVDEREAVEVSGTNGTVGDEPPLPNVAASILTTTSAAVDSTSITNLSVDSASTLHSITAHSHTNFVSTIVKQPPNIFPFSRGVVAYEFYQDVGPLMPENWDDLLARTAVAVDRFRRVINTYQHRKYSKRAEQIADWLCLVIASGSGTTDTHSVQPSVVSRKKELMPHFRHFMAAFSKLMLSSSVASTDSGPPDTEVKCLTEADEVLVGVFGYAKAARDLTGERLPRIKPGFIKGTSLSDGWKPSIKSLTSSAHPKSPDSPTSPKITEKALELGALGNVDAGLVDRMEKLDAAMRPALSRLDAVLSCDGQLVTSDEQQVIATDVIQAAHKVFDCMRRYFALLSDGSILPQLSGNVAVTDFQSQKQRLRDSYGDLFVACMNITAPLADEWTRRRGETFEERLFLARQAIKEVESGIRSLNFCTQLLVSELEKLTKNGASNDTSAKKWGHDRNGSRQLTPPGGSSMLHPPKAIKLLGEKPMPETAQYLMCDHDNEIVYGQKGQVKGGTLVALVERLTRHDMLDSNFNTTFLITYPSFTSAAELFHQLVRRFTIQPPAGIRGLDHENWVEKKQRLVRMRVLSILKLWLESNWMENGDQESKAVLQKMHFFAKEVMLPVLPGTSQILSLIETRLRGQEPENKRLVLTMSSHPPVPILPRNMRRLKFLDIDQFEFARQLTIIEARSYSKLRVVECLSKGWSKPPSKDAPDPAENIRAIIMQSNQLTNWVAEMILTQTEPRKRVVVIKHFIGVAEKCRQLNNFSTLTAILAAFQTASIHRLRRTWDHIPQRSQATLEGLNKLMGASMNFAEYREMLHIVNPPCVPFLGVYLKDLTFVADGNDDFIKGTELINFGKRVKAANIISEIQQYQAVPYPLTSVPELQDYIITNMQGARDVNDMYAVSLSLEPREREDEKIARLLQESGFL